MKTHLLHVTAFVLAMTLGTMTAAAPSRGSGTGARPPTANSGPALPPGQAFNRNAIGGASGVSPGMRARSYAIADALKRPGGAQAMGLRSKPYRNDGAGGSAVLPKTKNGKPVTYQSTYMRPGGHTRKLSNGRVVTGSDGSIYVSRHHGQGGEQVKRIQ